MTKRYGMTGLFLTLILVGGMLVFQNIFLDLDIPQAFASTAKAKGVEDAPVQIVEYSDFQCPACRFAQPVLKGFEEKYGGQLQLIYRHFPLSGHQWSGIAHPCAECAGEQGKFWEYHDLLFQEQEKWSGPQNPMPFFMEYAKSLGLDLDAFAACLTNPDIMARIGEEKQQGLDLKVRSTPTFFINGERFVGGSDLQKNGEAFIRKTLGLPAEEVSETAAEA